MFVLLKVQSLQLSFRPAGVSLGGGGGQGPLRPPPWLRPCGCSVCELVSSGACVQHVGLYVLETPPRSRITEWLSSFSGDLPMNQKSFPCLNFVERPRYIIYSLANPEMCLGGLEGSHALGNTHNPRESALDLYAIEYFQEFRAATAPLAPLWVCH